MIRIRVIAGMLTLLLVMVALAACAPSPTTSGTAVATATEIVTQSAGLPELSRNADGYFDITAEQLAKVSEGHEFTLVNVHIPYEGELPATDLFVPYNTITDHTDQLPAQNAPIVLYCRSGSMSTQAAKQLAELGYTNVYELDGGFNAWQAAGYALLHKQ